MERGSGLRDWMLLHQLSVLQIAQMKVHSESRMSPFLAAASYFAEMPKLVSQPMKLRADFSKREVVRPNDYVWKASPASGVERMMLDRIGDEVARATTIVRFAPNSQFDSHTHGGGEEYLVLEGVFSDEHGDYPAGTYVRNPIGTKHRPHIGPEGAKILVKLWQFDENDTEQKAVNTQSIDIGDLTEQGVRELILHDVAGERVCLIQLETDAQLAVTDASGGAEIFVLDGALSDEEGDYPAGTWMRLPAGTEHAMTSKSQSRIYIKTGHLALLD